MESVTCYLYPPGEEINNSNKFNNEEEIVSGQDSNVKVRRFDVKTHDGFTSFENQIRTAFNLHSTTVHFNYAGNENESVNFSLNSGFENKFIKAPSSTGFKVYTSIYSLF